LEPVSPAALGKSGTAKPSERDYSSSILRPTQLKDCLLAAHRLDFVDEELEFQSTKVDSENDSIARTKFQLEQDTPNPVSTQFALDEINRRIEMFNARVRTQKYAIDIYNQRVQAHSGEIMSWNSTCADHRFYLYDLNSIKADLPFSIEQYIKRESKGPGGAKTVAVRLTSGQ
jgi:hypothetical protein